MAGNRENILGPGNIDEIISNINTIITLINTVVGERDDIAAIPSDVTSAIAILKKIYNTAVNIEASLLVLTETGGTLTTDGTVQTVYINNAPAGIYSPKILQIDFTNQTAAETTVVREYYRIKEGGAFIKQDEVTFAGVQDPLLKTIELEENRFGVQITIEKTGGNAKAYDYEVVYAI